MIKNTNHGLTDGKRGGRFEPRRSVKPSPQARGTPSIDSGRSWASLLAIWETPDFEGFFSDLGERGLVKYSVL